MKLNKKPNKPPSPIGKEILSYLIEKHADLFFLVLRNIIPNLSFGVEGPVFITRFRDVQEVLERPEIFNVTYAPMIDPSVGPYMLGRDCTTINQRDKGIMRSLMRREDLPAVRSCIAGLVKDALSNAGNGEIDVVKSISRWVPARLTGEYFGFPGPNIESMLRWSRATQYDMFHNLDKNIQIHEDNIAAGAEMKAYLKKLIPQRKEALESNSELDDILSRLLKSTFPNVIGFDEERITANIMGTLVGGVETTSAAIVQILEQLFDRPDILAGAIVAAKNDDDELIYKYCWEALRFDPINPFVVRRCVKEYKVASGTFRSKKIKPGATVLVSGQSAMRDSREIPAASQFRLDRPDYQYMHLGYGLHTCLGDQVSKVQVPEIVKWILRLPNVRPTSKVDFENGPFPEKYTVSFSNSN